MHVTCLNEKQVKVIMELEAAIAADNKDAHPWRVIEFKDKAA